MESIYTCTTPVIVKQRKFFSESMLKKKTIVWRVFGVTEHTRLGDKSTKSSDGLDVCIGILAYSKYLLNIFTTKFPLLLQ